MVADWLDDAHVLSLYLWSVRFPVFLMYVALGLFDVVLVIRIVWNRHRLGYYFAFNLLVLVWDLFRCTFWILSNQFYDVPLLFYIFYNIPLDIQFATFSLLAVFYANVVHREHWTKIRPWIWAVYGLLNVFVAVALMVYVVTIFAVGNINDVSGSNWIERVREIFYAAITLGIITTLVVYGVLLARLVAVDDRVQSLLFIGRGKSKNWRRFQKFEIVAVNVVLWLAFSSRATYYILVSFLPDLALHLDSGNLLQDIFGYGLLIVWEIIPTLIVLMLFFNIPSSRPAVEAEQVVPGLAQKMPLLGAGETTSLSVVPEYLGPVGSLDALAGMGVMGEGYAPPVTTDYSPHSENESEDDDVDFPVERSAFQAVHHPSSTSSGGGGGGHDRSVGVLSAPYSRPPFGRFTPYETGMGGGGSGSFNLASFREK